MPRPDVIPMPMNSTSLHATECRPLPDGGLRCEPVVSQWERVVIWCVVAFLVLLILAYLWLEFDRWWQRRKTEAMFRRWRMQRTDREKLP